MAARISLRPDLDQDLGMLPLYVSGALSAAYPSVAYEGRLQISNASGPCTVEALPGSDQLPGGAVISVDNATSEVVVAWPEYLEYVTPLANPGFEAGDVSGWSFTTRGGSRAPEIDEAYRYEGVRSLKWPGGRGMGSEGGIEVEAWNNTIGPCLPGQRVTTRFRGMYNPAGHNFGSRYQALVRFLDSDGIPIGAPARGYQFKGRFHNGRWNDAVVSASGPAGTVGVQLGAWLTGSNAPVWMDAASWDVPSEVGIDHLATFNLVLRVRDSAGRTALWTGVLLVREPVPDYLDQLSVAPMAVYSKDKKISTAASGIRVRRSTDNAEADIGFVNKKLNEAQLLAFAGAGSAYVTTFYDQTGGGHHLTQASAAAQPQIVAAGTVNQMLEFDGVNDAFGTASPVPTDTAYLGIYGRMRLQDFGDGVVLESSEDYNVTDGSFTNYVWVADEIGLHAAYNKLDNRSAFDVGLGVPTSFALLYTKNIPKPTSLDIRLWKDGAELTGVRKLNRSTEIPYFLPFKLYMGGRAATSAFSVLGMHTVALYRVDTMGARDDIQAIIDA